MVNTSPEFVAYCVPSRLGQSRASEAMSEGAGTVYPVYNPSAFVGKAGMLGTVVVTVATVCVPSDAADGGGLLKSSSTHGVST